jgi:hypothetical protein
MKREKRIKKGIHSLEKQIKLHEEKKKLAEELNQEELIKYYDKEIESLKNRKENREDKLER